jgi:hypothetical protein
LVIIVTKGPGNKGARAVRIRHRDWRNRDRLVVIDEAPHHKPGPLSVAANINLCVF